VSIWYLEDGYQTTVPDDAFEYYDFETETRPLTPAEQGQQLVSALRLAYCQRYVGAFFNFLAVDDADLAGWQSGLFYADGTPKASYEPFRTAVAAINGDGFVCP
jgi:hypothetical protein